MSSTYAGTGTTKVVQDDGHHVSNHMQYAVSAAESKSRKTSCSPRRICRNRLQRISTTQPRLAWLVASHPSSQITPPHDAPTAMSGKAGGAGPASHTMPPRPGTVSAARGALLTPGEHRPEMPAMAGQAMPGARCGWRRTDRACSHPVLAKMPAGPRRALA